MTQSFAQGSLFEQPLDVQVVTVDVQQIEYPAGTETNPAIEKPGVLQSVLLAPTGNPACPYRVVDGKRRVRSAVKYGHTTVPAMITDGSRGQIAAASALLNAARGRNPLDEARNWQIALEEGRYLSIKDLAHDVRVNVSTIEKRLKLLRLPEHLLAHVGSLIAEGIAIQMAALPDDYLEDAVTAAEQKVLSGTKFTAKDFKESQTRRSADREDSFDSLFAVTEPSLPRLFEQVSPLDQLVSEVKRLCALSGVEVTALMAQLAGQSVMPHPGPQPGTSPLLLSQSPVLEGGVEAEDEVIPEFAGNAGESVVQAVEDEWLSDFMDVPKPVTLLSPTVPEGRSQLGLRSA